MTEFFYTFLSSRLAVGVSVSVLLALVAGAVFRIIPWWLFFLIIVLSGAGVALYAILRDWLALRRDKSFERGMGEQAETQMAKRKVRDRDAVRDMHDRWKEGFDRLRQSRAGRGRNAVYFFPWYLIIGKPATGKTTAIKNSGLHFPLGVPKTAGTGGTRNCDWFFTDEAILLDTAGRYAQSDENEADREEWLSFLRLVRKYRRDVPINGLLVAVAADDLLGRDRDEIAADARALRNKIDELIRELGIQFPVYLLITKCDLIQGFTEFFGRLPKTRLTELLGWTNSTFDITDLTRHLEEAFSALRDRCRALRPSFLNEETDPAGFRNVYLFPEELDALTKNLSQYCDVLFRETQYGESAFLRGIYLTSGLQTGTTVSRILGRLGLSMQAARVSEGSRSFFLQDFFQERLKGDQKLVAPTGRATVRFRMVNNLALGGAVVVSVLAGLLTGASYVRNRTLLLSIQDSVMATDVLPGKTPVEQMALLDEYRQAVETLRYRNEHRAWLERFGLYSGAAVESPVVGRFLDSYGNIGFLPALGSADTALANRQNPPAAFGALDSLISHLVLTKTAQSAELAAGGESLAPWWNTAAIEDPDTRARFAAAYRFYVREPWREDGATGNRDGAGQDRAQQLALVRENLPNLLTVDYVRRWLENGKPVRGADFDLPPGGAGKALVHPAFTPTSWQERVVPLLAALEQIENEVDADATSKFAQQYAAQYQHEWYQFVLDIQEPTGGYDSRRYCDEKSPYMAVFAAVRDSTTKPFVAGGQPTTAPGGGGAASAATGGTVIPGFEPPSWAQALGQVADNKSKYTEKMDPACRAGGNLGDPCAAVVQLAGGGGGGPVGPGPLGQIRDWVNENLVAVKAATTTDDRRLREHVASLLNVPVTQASRGGIDACAGHMKGQLRQALEPFPEKPPWTLEQLETIFVPARGLVWQYCDQTLVPFMSCATLVPKPNSPVRVPGDIVSFLNRAQRFSRAFFDSGGSWRTHAISFESVPTASRSDARVTQTTLMVSCSNSLEQPWKLSHRQTQVRKTLSWRPDQCAEARLQVTLSPSGGAVADERVVEISRPGPFGLLDLLAAGQHVENEFRWDFQEAPVTASFRIVLPDTGLLEASNIRLYR